MPSVSGKAIEYFRLARESEITLAQLLVDATGQKFDQDTDVVDNVTYDTGRNLEDRTRGSDEVKRWDELKANPSMEVTFDVNDDEDKAWEMASTSVASLGPPEGPFVFAMKVGRTLTAGRANIEGPSNVYNSANGVYQSQLTLRPVGSAWQSSRVAV